MNGAEKVEAESDEPFSKSDALGLHRFEESGSSETHHFIGIPHPVDGQLSSKLTAKLSHFTGEKNGYLLLNVVGHSNFGKFPRKFKAIPYICVTNVTQAIRKSNE